MKDYSMDFLFLDVAFLLQNLTMGCWCSRLSVSSCWKWLDYVKVKILMIFVGDFGFFLLYHRNLALKSRSDFPYVVLPVDFEQDFENISFEKSMLDFVLLDYLGVVIFVVVDFLDH